MNYKKIFFLVGFLAMTTLIFNFSLFPVRAHTDPEPEELQARILRLQELLKMIQEIQRQIIELRERLVGLTVESHIVVISPRGGEVWQEEKNHTIQWGQKGLEKWGNQATICLVGFDSSGQPIAAKGGSKSSACAYAESSQGTASYLITKTTLTKEKYTWGIPGDISESFEKPPVNYKASLLVFDELPQNQRIEWAGLIDQAESDDYFTIVSIGPEANILHVKSSPIKGMAVLAEPGWTGEATDYTKTSFDPIEVWLTAPSSYQDYKFKSWSGCNRTGPGDPTPRCWVSVTGGASRTITANYEPIISHTLTVKSFPSAGISIKSVTGHSGVTNYKKTLSPGTSVALEAPVSYDSFTFKNWTGCDSVISRRCLLTMNSDRTVNAHYAQDIELDEPSIALISPNGGEQWSEEETYKIIWKQTGLEQVKINVELLGYNQDGTLIGASSRLAGPYQIAVDIPAKQEYYSWTIPLRISEQFSLPVYKYKIRLANTRSSPIFVGDGIYIDGGESDNYFSIIEKIEESYSLTVNSYPVTGVSITGSSSLTEDAYYGGATNYTKIDLPSSTLISLTAPTSHDKYNFSKWTGCDFVGGSGNRTCSLKMDSDKTITVDFSTHHTLHVTSIPVSGISINSSTGHGGVTDYTKMVSEGTNISLAAPEVHDNYQFTQWSCVFPGGHEISFPMPSFNILCRAAYKEKTEEATGLKIIGIQLASLSESFSKLMELVRSLTER